MKHLRIRIDTDSSIGITGSPEGRPKFQNPSHDVATLPQTTLGNALGTSWTPLWRLGAFTRIFLRDRIAPPDGGFVRLRDGYSERSFFILRPREKGFL